LGALPVAPADGVPSSKPDKTNKNVRVMSENSEIRNEIRRLIAEELKQFLGKNNG